MVPTAHNKGTMSNSIGGWWSNWRGSMVRSWPYITTWEWRWWWLMCSEGNAMRRDEPWSLGSSVSPRRPPLGTEDRRGSEGREGRRMLDCWFDPRTRRAKSRTLLTPSSLAMPCCCLRPTKTNSSLCDYVPAPDQWGLRWYSIQRYVLYSVLRKSIRHYFCLARISVLYVYRKYSLWTPTEYSVGTPGGSPFPSVPGKNPFSLQKIPTPIRSGVHTVPLQQAFSKPPGGLQQAIKHAQPQRRPATGDTSSKIRQDRLSDRQQSRGAPGPLRMVRVLPIGICAFWTSSTATCSVRDSRYRRNKSSLVDIDHIDYISADAASTWDPMNFSWRYTLRRNTH